MQNYFYQNIKHFQSLNHDFKTNLELIWGIDYIKKIKNHFLNIDFALWCSKYLDVSIDLLIKKNWQTKPHHICQLLALDVDGVLTDSGMYFSDTGIELKRFNAKDGLAIKIMQKKNIKVGLISSGKNETLLKNRAEILDIDLVTANAWEKDKVLNQWALQLNIDIENTAYIGDDINDIPALKSAGISACPADASIQAKAHADILLMHKGGMGCVREFAEYMGLITF